MIELNNVSKIYKSPDGRETTAVDQVSLTIDRGETFCLIGSSGCGKTTTMKLINRLIEPTEGEILIDGASARDMDVIRLRRRIGYVIQKGGLFPHMTVFKNISILCQLENWPPNKIAERVRELMELVNLPYDEYAQRYPSELSGGQRQRVGVVRALALDPEYVLMDEPFGALDPLTRTQIHTEFQQMEALIKKTIVIVTHDMAEAFLLGNRVALMDQGKIVQIGTEEDFRERPANDFVRDFLRQQFSNAKVA